MAFEPIEAFSVGKWQDAGGTIHDFPAGVVNEVAETYDTSRHRAAIVTNHSEQGPGGGFVKSLRFDGNKLFAEPEQIDEQLKSEVDAGKWPNVSIRLYPPNHPNNPAPGKWSLRHLSYVVTGAVKGLAAPYLREKAPAFAENKDGFVDLFLAFEEAIEPAGEAPIAESIQVEDGSGQAPAIAESEAPTDVGADDFADVGASTSDEVSTETPIEIAIDAEPELPTDESLGDQTLTTQEKSMSTESAVQQIDTPEVETTSADDRQLLAEYAEAQAELSREKERIEAEKAEIAKFKAEAAERVRKADERLKQANAEIEARKTAIAAQEASAKKERENTAFCDQLVKAGKLTGDDDYAEMMAILKGPSLDKEVCFSDAESNEYTYDELLRHTLTKWLPVKVDFGEKAAGSSDSAKSGPMSALEISRAAKKMVADMKAAGNDMTYEEAVNRITGGK